MKTSEKIESAVSRFKEGEVFTYDKLNIRANEYGAASKAMERQIKSGNIKRASTGRFYKPEKTAFGELKPSEEQLLRPYLFEGNKRVAYITGTSLYNKMGLTTQIPKNIRVASRSKRIATKVGSIQVKPVKSYVDVKDENYRILEILDALKDFKEIPDLAKKEGLKLLTRKIKDLASMNLDTLIKIALKYPPRVRALLGALLNKANADTNKIQPLLKSLNFLTRYNFGITPEILPTSEKWNIS